MAQTSTILAAWNRVRKRSFSVTLSEDLDAKAVVPYWACRRRPNCPHLSYGPSFWTSGDERAGTFQKDGLGVGRDDAFFEHRLGHPKLV
jgi:hypothetical protein